MFALNETRLDNSIRDIEIKIPHYVIVRKDRNRFGGGVAIYIHESLMYTVLEHDSLTHLEAIPVLIQLKNTQPIIFINWYRPPNSKNEVFDSYEKLTSFVGGFNCQLILMGDTNCDILKRPISCQTRNYNHINSVYSLDQIKASECTRIVNGSSILIDHMLTNYIDKIKSSGVIHNGLSDHSMSFMVWKSHCISMNEKYVTFRKCTNVDIEGLKTDVKNQAWGEIESFEDIDEAANRWKELLLTVIDKHMPFKTKRVRHKQTPWLNESLYALMKDRDKMKKKAISKKEEKFWIEYRRLRNKVTSENRKFKKKYYSDKLCECQSRSQSWKVLKSITTNKSSSSTIPISSNDTQNVADKFNFHFANVAIDLINDLMHM